MCPVVNLDTAVPTLLTPDEVAAVLRTSRKQVYAMVERGTLPGIVRVGRRLLFDRDHLVRYLNALRVPSPGEAR
jgi:excisionase family DNA binding protein